MDQNYSMKWISLALLTIQNVSLVLLMRYVRIRPGDMFSSATAVVCSELVKFFASLLILLYTFKFKFNDFFSNIHDNIIKDWKDWLLIAVPAVLYVFQNNLLFVAVSNLDAATFQVCYQLKLLTTALFFRMILKGPQSFVQWCSLFSLFCGIVIVQLNQSKASSKTKDIPHQNPLLGVAVVLLASLMSGFGGVFFEKILKGTPKNVWIRNVQLATYGVVFGLITVLFVERQAIFDRGFFYGYDSMVWLVILIQSIGGLLVAVVIKYADNILKGFATSVAIVLASIFSIYLFQFLPGMSFILGSSIVICSTILYSMYPYKEKILNPILNNA